MEKTRETDLSFDDLNSDHVPFLKVNKLICSCYKGDPTLMSVEVSPLRVIFRAVIPKVSFL
jgi:hypothetical protein